MFKQGNPSVTGLVSTWALYNIKIKESRYSSVDLISQSVEVHPSFARPRPRCEFFRFVSLKH